MFIVELVKFIWAICLLCTVIGAFVFIPALVGIKKCRWVLVGAIVTFIACFGLLCLGKYQHQKYAPPEYDMEKIVASVDIDQVAVSNTTSVEYTSFFNKEYYVYYVTPTPTPIPHPEWLAEEE